MTKTAQVIVVSTRTAAGTRDDSSGELLVSWLQEEGYETPEPTVVADGEFPTYWRQLLGERQGLADVIITTGGTGITADDVTAEIVEPSLDKQLPGVMHAFWAKGCENTPLAVLSGGVAGTIGQSFVMTLPGSPSAVKDGVSVLDELLDHIYQLLNKRHPHDE